MLGRLVAFALGAGAATLMQRVLRPSRAALRRPAFVLFGDSITQRAHSPAGGWAARLADDYQRKADVINRGFSGYNTRWALHLLKQVFPEPNEDEPAPALVTIFFGANDAALPERECGFQHVPIAEYKANLRTIIQHLQANCAATRIVLLTPPPLDEVGRLAYLRGRYAPGSAAAPSVPERTNAAAGTYAFACKEVAAEFRLPVVDLWTRFQLEPAWESLLDDGLHLAPGGQLLAFQGLWDVIAQSFPGLLPSALRSDFPQHTDFGPKELKDLPGFMASWPRVDPLPPHGDLGGAAGVADAVHSPPPASPQRPAART